MNFKKYDIPKEKVMPVLKEVCERWDYFNRDQTRQRYLRVQGETQQIPLVGYSRPPEGVDHWDWSGIQNKEWIDDFPKCLEILKWLKDMLKVELYRVAILKLQDEGDQVYPHYDKGEYYIDKHRYHLVLSGYYDYNVDGETQVFSAGELWWFDNKKFHHSVNRTPMPRIALCFDGRPL